MRKRENKRKKRVKHQRGIGKRRVIHVREKVIHMRERVIHMRKNLIV